MPKQADDGADRSLRVVLVGMMGSGKTTVGRLRGRHASGRGFADTDEEVESSTRESRSQEMFETDGEAAFRRRGDRSARDPASTRTGRGHRSGRGSRARAGRTARLMRRRGDGRLAAADRWHPRRPGRLRRGPPASRDRPRSRLERTAAAGSRIDRQNGALCTSPSPTSSSTPTGCRRRRGRRRRRLCVRRWLRMITIPVDLGRASYPVLVGAGAIALRSRTGPEAPRRLSSSSPRSGSGWRSTRACRPRLVMLPDGEKAKSLATVEELCSVVRPGIACRETTRWSQSAAVSTTDVAGLAAALYHRGIAYVNVPTTLLGQVDAAIGGKTGVNLPEGKNLVGAFWQPSAVLCDTDTLATLDEREIASGRGEMAKYAFLGDDPPGTGLLALPIDEQVARCVALKVECRDDRRDATSDAARSSTTATPSPTPSRRRRSTGSTSGICGTARPSRSVSSSPQSSLPDSGGSTRSASSCTARWSSDSACRTRCPMERRRAELVGLMARDKKAHGDLTFVLDGPNGVEPVAGVDPVLVTDTLVAMGCDTMTTLDGRPGTALPGGRARCQARTSTCSASVSPRSTGTSTSRTTSPRPSTRASGSGCAVEHHQSNHEGALIEEVHRARKRAVGIVVNAGALSHTSWALHDALAAFDGVVVELHLSNPAAREPYRHTSVLASATDGMICGFGGLGYRLAVNAVAQASRSHGARSGCDRRFDASSVRQPTRSRARRAGPEGRV